MYETPINGIKFGGHRPRCPATDPGKKAQFFKLFEDIRYHYYMIHTSFRRQNGGEFNEVLFPIFSLRLQRF